MIVVWGVPLTAELGDILQELGFRRPRRSGMNLMVRCPFHEDGKPSCGVHEERGVFNCFTATCGAKGDLVDLALRVKPELGDKVGAFRWLASNFAAAAPSDRPDLTKSFQHWLNGPARPAPPTYEEVQAYVANGVHPYVLSRGVSERTAATFDIGYDPAEDAITIPWHNERRSPLFIKKRAVSRKAYLNDADVLKGHTVYGLWLVRQRGLRRAAVVEGEFDCLWLWENGLPAVCIGGSVPTEHQMKLLLRCGVTHLDLFLDNPLIDEAGRKGAERIQAEYGGLFRVRRAVYPSVEWKDANEVPAESLPLPPHFEDAKSGDTSKRVIFV